jgi:UDP-galactopyranose mutase
MHKRKRALVVGAGFSGAVCARELAAAGYAVTLIDKRGHIGGNAYEAYDNAGIRVHQYGPHIFHTDNQRVYEYLSEFTQWYPYEHRVLGRIDNTYVPIPFNFASIDALYGKKAEGVKKALHSAFPNAEKLFVSELRNSDIPAIRELGEFIYQKVFINYTIKQWGTRKIDERVINRVPVVAGYDDRYFHDRYQVMPVDGYTALFERLLNHSDIQLRLNCDAKDCISLIDNKVCYNGEHIPVCVYTGPIDELLGYRFGPLPYRSLDLRLETVNAETYQPAAVVNYPNEEEFTRITEFKYITGQQCPKTTVLREYPRAYDWRDGSIPYYPVESHENRALYEKYAALLSSVTGLYFCGRLAQYKYYNMDAAVDAALKLSEMIIQNGGKL